MKMKKVSAKQTRLIAAYAVKVIESHLNKIRSAAGWHNPEDFDPHYDYWLKNMQNIQEMLDGKDIRDMLKEQKEKLSPEGQARFDLHMAACKLDLPFPEEDKK